MKPHLRVARPSDDLQEMVNFYCNGLGFQVIGSFYNHAGFDGVMLGHKGLDYHLEFTHRRGYKSGRAPTKENLLVLYLPDKSEWEEAVRRMEECGYKAVESENPYWDERGKTFEDGDGYRVVLEQAAWG